MTGTLNLNPDTLDDLVGAYTENSSYDMSETSAIYHAKQDYNDGCSIDSNPYAEGTVAYFAYENQLQQLFINAENSPEELH
jgi:hypothetical protein